MLSRSAARSPLNQRSLCERGALDLMLQPRVLRMVLPTDTAPEDGILRLGIEDHTIEVEKGCLERSLLHFSEFWVQN